VVTGSGSKTNYVKQNDELPFGRDIEGFASLHIYEDGQTWLRFYTPKDKGETEQVLYSTRIDS
jgi:hypothetical protein